MYALTIWQPWASLIIAGAKPYEFRRWQAPRSIVGQRIAIHAAARKPTKDEIDDLIHTLSDERFYSEIAVDPAIGLPIVEDAMYLPMGVVVGTALLGTPIRAHDLKLIDDRESADPKVWAWPMQEIRPLTPPRHARGAQGFWKWEG